jgi:Fe-S-cluster containining protein
MEVPLNHYDLARLEAARPDLVLEQIVRLLPGEPTDPDSIHLAEGWYTLCLPHSGPERGCHFLKENQCSLYEARPGACQNWPLALNHRQQPEIFSAHRLLWELACDKTPQRNMARLRANLQAHLHEFNAYRRLVKRWNENIQSQNPPVEQSLKAFWQFARESLREN